MLRVRTGPPVMSSAVALVSRAVEETAALLKVPRTADSVCFGGARHASASSLRRTTRCRGAERLHCSPELHRCQTQAGQRK
jgi:hypothetical protein